jgi:hypothetical protein
MGSSTASAATHPGRWRAHNLWACCTVSWVPTFMMLPPGELPENVDRRGPERVRDESTG